MPLIPENLLRLMSAADRKQFGKAGWNMAEVQERVDLRLERKLHSDYVGFLRRHGFKDHQIITSPMNRKSFLPQGFPDFLIQRGGRFLYLEFKTGNNRLSPIQELVIADLIADGCRVLVLYTYKAAVEATLDFFTL
jgi:hypothetical protein